MRFVPIVVSALAAATAFATGAQAGGTSAYVGLRGSIIQTDDGTTTSGPINYDESYQDGFGAAAFIGWVLDDNFRLELEGGYRSADLDSVRFTRNDVDPTTVGGRFGVAGHANVGAFMANLYYDIHCFGDIGVLPWVGVGVGGAYIEYNLTADIFDGGETVLDAKDSTKAFAYQAMAGITVPLADNISGSVGYRFFQTPDFGYTDVFGLGFQTKLTQQSIDVGLQFHL